jgi:uncharacterized membrane protein
LQGANIEMQATSSFLIVFRIVHILAGVAWAGSVFLLVIFVQPSAAAIGPKAGPFMQELLGKRRLVLAILWMAAATIVAGAFLYWHDWQAVGGFGDWVETRFGLGLTIGAIASIMAFLIGLFGTRPGVARLLALGRRAAEGDGPPASELSQEIAGLQLRLRLLARTSLALLAVAVLAMATARYW